MMDVNLMDVIVFLRGWNEWYFFWGLFLRCFYSVYFIYYFFFLIIFVSFLWENGLGNCWIVKCSWIDIVDYWYWVKGWLLFSLKEKENGDLGGKNFWKERVEK